MVRVDTVCVLCFYTVYVLCAIIVGVRVLCANTVSLCVLCVSTVSLCVLCVIVVGGGVCRYCVCVLCVEGQTSESIYKGTGLASKSLWHRCWNILSAPV